MPELLALLASTGSGLVATGEAGSSSTGRRAPITTGETVSSDWRRRGRAICWRSAACAKMAMARGARWIERERRSKPRAANQARVMRQPAKSSAPR